MGKSLVSCFILTHGVVAMDPAISQSAVLSTLRATKRESKSNYTGTCCCTARARCDGLRCGLALMRRKRLIRLTDYDD